MATAVTASLASSVLSSVQRLEASGGHTRVPLHSRPRTALRATSLPSFSRMPLSQSMGASVMNLSGRPGVLHATCSQEGEAEETVEMGRRGAMVVTLGAAVALPGLLAADAAEAVSTSRRALRGSKVPEEEYTQLDNGLKVYDLTVGTGAEAVRGARVVVHYVAKWKGITFVTSRQGAGVTGGSPYGFDVGNSELGYVLRGLDLGVQGMREGGQRLLLVPPELAYGNKGFAEIPPNATIELDIELLTIKKNAAGTRF